MMPTQVPMMEMEDELPDGSVLVASSPMGMEEMADEMGEVELTIDPATGDVMMEMEETSLMPAMPMQFGDNLAELVEEDELETLGKTIIDWVEADLKDRKPWYDRYRKGLEAMGVYDPAETNETLNTAEIVHPLIIEAATQFQARAMAELYPPSGPVKCSPIGDPTQEKLDQATRVAGYMNYQLTVEDRTYYDERDQMLFRLSLSGSEFDKQYYCPVEKRVVSRWVRAENFVVPAGTTSLQKAQHYTEIIDTDHNAYRRAVRAGFYRDVELGDGSEDKPEGLEDLERTVSEMQGEEDKPSLAVEGNPKHVFYECHCEIDLPTFEDTVALPYIITVDKDSGKVLGIRRNWKESDPDQRKRVWYTHKKFLPGFGFYGFGFIHAIGGLGEAATKILNILIDGGAFASLPGGFKSRDAKIKGEYEMTPGQWIDTEMSAEELNKAFFPFPTKEPSPVLQAVLGVCVDGGRRFAATTEVQVGDAATTGPVGTTVALIEQGSKVFSGIHKRLHKGSGDEFINIATLNGEHLPDSYPYASGDGQQYVLRQDFDERVDVLPVSDPNIFSSAQRIAMAQSAFQLTQAVPDLADRREAALEVLRAMRFPDPERMFPQPMQAERADPVTEGALAVLGRPLRAFLDQNHQAHLVTHQLQMQGLPPPLQPAMQAHIQEHMAMTLRLRYQQMMGVQLPPMNWGAQKGAPMTMPLPPQVEDQIAVMAAQASQQLMQQMQAQQQAQQPQQGPAPQGEDPRVAEAAFAAEQDRKDAAFQADQARKDEAASAAVDRKDAMEGISPAMVKQASEFIAQTGIQMSPRMLALLSRETGMPFIETLKLVSQMMMQGQGAGPVPVSEHFNKREIGYT